MGKGCGKVRMHRMLRLKGKSRRLGENDECIVGVPVALYDQK